MPVVHWSGDRLVQLAQLNVSYTENSWNVG